MLSQGLRYPVFVRHYSSYSYHNFRLYLIGCSSHSIYHCYSISVALSRPMTSLTHCKLLLSASWHLLLYGSPSPLFCTPYSVVGLVGTIGFEPIRISPRERPSRLPFRHTTHKIVSVYTRQLTPLLTLLGFIRARSRSMPLANDDIRFVSDCSTPAFPTRVSQPEITWRRRIIASPRVWRFLRVRMASIHGFKPPGGLFNVSTTPHWSKQG